MNFNIADIITGLAALLSALIIVYKGFRSAPSEVRAANADIVSKYEQVAKSAAERAEHLEMRLDEMEKKYQAECEELHKQIGKLEVMNQEKDQCIDDLRDLLEETKAELELAMQGRESREQRIVELEKRVKELEGKK